MYPQVPPPFQPASSSSGANRSHGPSHASASTFPSKFSFSELAAGQTSTSTSGPSSSRTLLSTEDNKGAQNHTSFRPSTPARPSPLSIPASSAPNEQEHSPYKEIVDFLQTKREDKLNQMEIIGLTQSLRKNATRPAQEVIDYLEAAANVPSAALLGAFQQPTNFVASPNKPLLFPPSVQSTSSPATSSPSRSRRKRNMYTGVGQSPRKLSAPPLGISQPTPSRLRLQQPVAESSEPAAKSNKKRLVGDSAMPVSSGVSDQVVSVSSTTSTVPFPLESPAKPQRAPPPTNAGPSSRPTMNGTRTGLFGATGRPPAVTRPEAPRQPSPLRKSNLGEFLTALP